MPGEPPVAAVVLDALAAPADPGLDAAVGAGSAQRLRRELRAIARRWVACVAPGNAFEATSAGAAEAALAGHEGAVVLVAPDIPSLGSAHAASVGRDLAAGVDLALGLTYDGSPYLVVLARHDPELVEQVAIGWEGLIAAARARGIAVAMLRHERRLATASDARAVALDPLAPAALAAELGRLRAGRRPAP